MQGIFQKENTDKALKYGIYRHLPTYEKIIRNLVSFYTKKLGREKRIPFEVSVDPFYSQENMTRLRESVAQMEATGGTIHEVNFDD